MYGSSCFEAHRRGESILQNEIKTPQNLLSELGRPTACGWAREPILTYDRSEVKHSFVRGREWDHYVIQSSKYALSLCIADYGCFGLATAMLVDFRGEMRRYINTKIKLMTLGRLNMPNSTRAGDANFADRKIGMKFSRSANNRYIKSEFMNFHDGKMLTVSIALDNPDDNSIVISTSFPKKPDAFAYCQKVIGMPASGFVKFGGEEFTFDVSDSRAFLDWGRGVLPRDNRWYWGALGGKLLGEDFGFNFGGGLGDTSQGSENAIFYGGKLYKISGLSAQAPKEPEKRWKFFTKDRRIQLQFTPVLDCGERFRVLTASLDQKLQFGTFSGRVVLDGGQELKIDKMRGFSNWVHNYF